MKTMILAAVTVLVLGTGVGNAKGLARESVPPAAPAAGLVSAQTPAREGNIWDWRDHQPTETQVQRDEKAAGIAPTASQQASDAAALRLMYRQLTH